MDWDNVFCEALCVDVHDGDTITLKVDIRSLIKKYYPNDLNQVAQLPEKSVCLSCRLQGYNCAELNSKDPEEKEQAIKDKEFVTSKLLGKVVQCDFGKNDTYNRVLTHVYFGTSQVCLNELMLELGHAPCQKNRKGFNYVNYPSSG